MYSLENISFYQQNLHVGGMDGWLDGQIDEWEERWMNMWVDKKRTKWGIQRITNTLSVLEAYFSLISFKNQVRLKCIKVLIEWWG